MNFSLLDVGLILGGVGVLLLIIAVGIVGRTCLFLLTAKTCSGQVIGVAQRQVPGSNRTAYSPMVAFEVEGRRYQFQGTSGSLAPRFKVGDGVSVIYKAGAPTQAQLRTGFGLWGLSWVLGGLGVGFCVVGVGVLFFAGRGG
ncbi:MAG: DUF3592 domain-containing protein [Spirulina sp. SIO3F2]|nr:DUF3592 domain-containing protein [Spirulina sp. SIO3F2]